MYGTTRRFAARPAGGPGVYTADVVFGPAGRYDYTVDDGFTNAVPHTFAAVEVRERTVAPAAAGGGFPFLPVTGVLILAAALGLGALRRGRNPARPRPGRRPRRPRASA